jgi:hypothetical protein
MSMAQIGLNLPDPTQLTEDQLASQTNAADASQQVHGQGNSTASVWIENVGNKVRLNGSNTGAVGYHDFIGLYRSNFPEDPNSNLVASQYIASGLPKDTNVEYGPRLLAAYVAWDYRPGRSGWIYLAKTGPTT